MTDRPIIFSGPMVRALLAGRKTQTRRLLNPQPDTFLVDGAECKVEAVHVQGDALPRVATGLCLTSQKVPYAKGDRLYVRETWNGQQYAVEDEGPAYTGTQPYAADFKGTPVLKWKPSIHMPRWASRLTLLVDDVRIERLQAISRADAIAEGLSLASSQIEEFWRWPKPYHENLWLSPPAAYRHLWNELHGPDAWDANPWVVALTFRVERGNIDQIGAAA